MITRYHVEPTKQQLKDYLDQKCEHTYGYNYHDCEDFMIGEIHKYFDNLGYDTLNQVQEHEPDLYYETIYGLERVMFKILERKGAWALWN